MRIRTIAVLGIMMLAIAGTMPVRAQVEVSVRTNFSDLDEYGEWMHVHGYGTVWRPYAEEGWRPFTYGHWVYTRDGWLWDSDEPFGWIVCHYGNWCEDEELGWIWVPGYDWSPARVEWNVTEGEIAWAPLPPLFGPGHHRPKTMRLDWMFCPAPLFTSSEVRTHIEVRQRPFQAETRVHVYGAPPRLEFVKRVVREPIITVTPNRVRVERGERQIVRVEVANPSRERVVVPVGPGFRKSNVRTEVQPSSGSSFTPDRDSRNRVVPEENRSHFQPSNDRVQPKVRVESNDRVEAKVRVEPKVRVQPTERVEQKVRVEPNERVEPKSDRDGDNSDVRAQDRKVRVKRDKDDDR
jgi:hypothetical protein